MNMDPHINAQFFFDVNSHFSTIALLIGSVNPFGSFRTKDHFNKLINLKSSNCSLIFSYDRSQQSLS